MRVPGLKTARLTGRWLRSRLTGGVPILGYHRVADSLDDPYGMCVSPGRFAEQMEVLRLEARPVTLEEFLHARRSGRLPRRAVVVTFDDGYADNLHEALPVLQRHEVPATLFVTTGRLGESFWWDELARAVPAASGDLARLGPALERVLGGSKPSWTDLCESRRNLLGDLSRRMQQMTSKDRQGLLCLLGESTAGTERDGAERALTEGELRQLAETGLVGVGSHTTSHAPLAGLTVDRQRVEIVDSKRKLEEILGRRVTAFAYPHGSVGTATPALLEEAGFACACGSHNDLASARSDPYRLPRFWVGDWGGARFSRWLNHWLRG